MPGLRSAIRKKSIGGVTTAAAGGRTTIQRDSFRNSLSGGKFTPVLRPQERDDGAPFGRVVAGSLRCRVRASSAPKLRIESGLRRAECHVHVAPKSINTVWILATRVGHG